MADNLDEKVSALVDGELPRDEVGQLITALKEDAATQTCWRHFHLISDALKNNLPDRVPEDFVRRVSMALESEPALSNPPTRLNTHTKSSSLHAPTIGFALAASVAAIAFLGLGWNSLNEAERTPGSAVVAEVAPTAPPAVTTVSTLPANSYTQVHGRQWDVEQPDVISKLNSYLISHDQFSLTSGVRSGVLPQVRIVGYERAEPVQQPDAAANNDGP